MGNFPNAVDVVVVGAGICGVTCDASLAARGATVLVVEKGGTVASEQSGRAQGAIRVQGREPAEIPLALEALSLWRQVDAADDIELTFGGNMYICTDESEVRAASELVSLSHQAGLHNVRLLDPIEARQIIPAATGTFVAAMWSAHDGQCQPAKATEYFARRACTQGAVFAYDTLVTKIVERGGTVSGVETSHGPIAARAVVLAGGVWTSVLAATAGVNVPLMPVAVSECETEAVAPLIPATLRTFHFGARQRPGGTIVVSAGMGTVVDHYVSFASLRNLHIWARRLFHHRNAIRLRYDWRKMLREVSERSVVSPKLITINQHPEPNRALMDKSHRALAGVIPALRSVRIARYWAGMIDMSPDGLPIVDASTGPEGMVILAGLSGHGLALGPVLGEIAGDLALTRHTSRPIAPFSLQRFEHPTAIPRKMM